MCQLNSQGSTVRSPHPVHNLWQSPQFLFVTGPEHMAHAELPACSSLANYIALHVRHVKG